MKKYLIVFGLMTVISTTDSFAVMLGNACRRADGSIGVGGYCGPADPENHNKPSLGCCSNMAATAPHGTVFNPVKQGSEAVKPGTTIYNPASPVKPTQN